MGRVRHLAQQPGHHPPDLHPSWDFNWQGFFTFPSLTKIPAGYTLHGIASYDNTSANPFNPNDPPQNVTFGEGTTDEMFFVFFDYVLYEEGDEQISLEPADPSCQEDLDGDGFVSVNDILVMLSILVAQPTAMPTLIWTTPSPFLTFCKS